MTISLRIITGILFVSTWLFAGEISTREIKSRLLHDLPQAVSVHTLDNGMQILLIENPALPMVGVNVVVKVGSAYETFATSGMSHMLEHLLFNGTTNRTQKQLYDEVDQIGGYNNANTSDYYTNYMMVTPYEFIKTGMELQADMLFNSILPVDKFEKEKGIVLEEISKSLANPREQIERNVISVLYPGHALSLPTLGTYATIEAMVRDEVFEFYKNNYVPNNMILSAIGNFKTGEMLKTIKSIYGKIKPATVKRNRSFDWNTGFKGISQIPAQSNSVYHRFYDGNDILAQVYYPLTQTANSDFYHMLDIVLTKKSDEIKSSIKSEYPTQLKSLKISIRSTPVISFLEIAVTLEESVDFERLVKLLSFQLGKLKLTLAKENIQAEIARVRTSFLKNIEKPHMFGIYNAHEFAVNGIEAVLASYSGSGLLAAADDVKQLKLVADPVVLIQKPLDNENQNEMGVSNEIKMYENGNVGPALIAVQNKVSNLLAIHYLVKHKSYYESRYGKNAAKVLHDCLGQRLRSDENQKLSSRFGFTFVVNDNPYIPMDDIYLDPDFGYIRVEGLADDISGAIDYLNSQLKDFLPTESEFHKAVEKFKQPDPMMMGGNRTEKIFKNEYKKHIYEPAKYSEGSDDLTYENILSFNKEYFNASNMIISVVSPAEPDDINKYYQQFIGESDQESIEVYRKRLKLQSEPVQIDKKTGVERAYLFWGFTKEIDPNDESALKVLSLILADQIIFDIREKQGMAYHMKAGIEIIGDKALFYINQGTRGENVETLIPQYPGFFQKEKIASVTQEELQKSVNMYLGRMMFRRLSSINQAYYLAHSLYFHNDIDYDKKHFENLKRVELKDVQRVTQKYLKIQNPVLVITR